MITPEIVLNLYERGVLHNLEIIDKEFSSEELFNLVDNMQNLIKAKNQIDNHTSNALERINALNKETAVNKIGETSNV